MSFSPKKRTRETGRCLAGPTAGRPELSGRSGQSCCHSCLGAPPSQPARAGVRATPAPQLLLHFAAGARVLSRLRSAPRQGRVGGQGAPQGILRNEKVETFASTRSLGQVGLVQVCRQVVPVLCTVWGLNGVRGKGAGPPWSLKGRSICPLPGPSVPEHLCLSLGQAPRGWSTTRSHPSRLCMTMTVMPVTSVLLET